MLNSLRTVNHTALLHSPLAPSPCTGPAPAPAPSADNGTFHTTGLILDSGPDPTLNRYFRYASVGFTGTRANPSWNYSRAVDWSATGYVSDPLDQGACGECLTLNKRKKQ